MSKKSDPNNSSVPSLIKTPHKKTEFKNEQELEDFLKCCDPDTGYLHFMENFFMIQHPTRGSINYKPYDYQRKLIDIYHNYQHSIGLMFRQSGKCLEKNVKIKIRNIKESKQYELPIELYYQYMYAKRNGTELPDLTPYEKL